AVGRAQAQGTMVGIREVLCSDGLERVPGTRVDCCIRNGEDTPRIRERGAFASGVANIELGEGGIEIVGVEEGCSEVATVWRELRDGEDLVLGCLPPIEVAIEDEPVTPRRDR